MKEQPKPIWYEQLKQTPWDSPKLSSDNMERLINHANANRTPTHGRFRNLSWLSTGAAVLLIILAVVWLNVWPERIAVPSPSTPPQPSAVNVPIMQPSAFYRDDGTKVFEAFPGGDSESGRANGCWWNIYIPFEELKGSRLTVEAVHKASGMRFSEIPELEITSPSLAYNDFTRISSRLDVPYGGVWEYSMYVNDNKLGEIALDIPEGSWQPSSAFSFDSSTLTGVKGRIGVLNADLLGAGLPDNKYMWYFWGRDDTETRSLFANKITIAAALKGSPTSITVFEGSIGTPNALVNPPIPDNDKVAKVPASMSLPAAGVWRLDAIIDGRWFGSVFVNVK